MCREREPGERWEQQELGRGTRDRNSLSGLKPDSLNKCGWGRHFLRSRNTGGSAGREWCPMSSQLSESEVAQASQPSSASLDYLGKLIQSYIFYCIHIHIAIWICTCTIHVASIHLYYFPTPGFMYDKFIFSLEKYFLSMVDVLGTWQSLPSSSSRSGRASAQSEGFTKWLKNLNLRCDTIELLEESICKIFSDKLLLFSCSVLWLCNPMDSSMPGFPVLHHLPELAQTHVHWVGDAIQPSHPLSSPSHLAFNLYQHQGLF